MGSRFIDGLSFSPGSIHFWCYKHKSVRVKSPVRYQLNLSVFDDICIVISNRALQFTVCGEPLTGMAVAGDAEVSMESPLAKRHTISDTKDFIKWHKISSWGTITTIMW